MKYKIPSPAVLIIALFIFPACNDHHHKPDLPEFPVQVASIPLPTIPFQPEKYECLLASSEIVIDGKMEEEAWEKAQWTKTFTDIEGPSKPKPRFDTRVKMLWDSNYFYIAAQLEEPHVWGKLKQRDTILFHDNDFEVFIDPDGDTHQYYEIEINTLGTLFDLMLVKPYRDGGPAIISWDAPLMQSAVHIDGTLNDRSDEDEGWSVEMAIPWKYINDTRSRPKHPNEGDLWRVNFSRVEYELEEGLDRYHRKKNSEGKRLPEANWVWSPQGVINMHYPEMWGFVKFMNGQEALTDTFDLPEAEEAKWALRMLYYNQRIYAANNGRYSADPGLIGADSLKYFRKAGMPEIYLFPKGYEIQVKVTETGNIAWIRNDSETGFRKNE